MNTIDNKAAPAVQDIPQSEAPKQDAPREGQSGKGNVHGEQSKAQLRKAFESDSSALASVLIALGAIERVQRGKNGVIARRVYAELPTLERNRSALSAVDKKTASAALDALRAVGALRGKFVSIELFAQSVAVRSRTSAGQHHKPTK